MWQEVGDAVDRHQRFVISSHITPDGDAVGSVVGLGEYLRGRDKEVLALLPDPAPAMFAFLDAEKTIQVYDPADHLGTIKQAEVWFCLDFTGPVRMGRLADAMPEFTGTLISIDHHTSPEEFAAISVGDSTAAATSALIAEFLEWAGAEWTDCMVTALYGGLVSDTGNFQYSNATARAFGIAGRLVDRGADPGEVYRRIYEIWSWPRLRLLGEVINRLELICRGRVAITTVSQSLLQRTGTTIQDLESFINYGRMVEGVEVSVVISELGPQKCKASFRSNGTVDVAAVARSLGGGGHRNAAGSPLELPLDQGRIRVEEVLQGAFSKPDVGNQP